MINVVRSVLFFAVAQPTFAIASQRPRRPRNGSRSLTHAADPSAPPLRDDIAARIKDTMKEFAEKFHSAGNKRTHLVVHGDSTMSGLSYRMNEAVGSELIYSFYSCGTWGQKCIPVSYAPSLAAQPSYKEYRDVFDNVEAAFKVLQGCSDGNTGGALWVTSHFGGSLIKYMWSFSPENQFNACWNPCMTDAIKALKPHAVVVNQGLHLLHIHPGRPCNSGSYYKCGKYQDNVENILSSIQEITPITLWRMTNWVCDAKYNRAWHDTLAGWRDPNRTASLETQCRRECEGFSDSNPCNAELLEAGGAWRQYSGAKRAIEAVKAKGGRGVIGMVDAFDITYSQCKHTKDARHYKALDGDIALRMAQELVLKASIAIED